MFSASDTFYFERKGGKEFLQNSEHFQPEYCFWLEDVNGCVEFLAIYFLN